MKKYKQIPGWTIRTDSPFDYWKLYIKFWEIESLSKVLVPWPTYICDVFTQCPQV